MVWLSLLLRFFFLFSLAFILAFFAQGLVPKFHQLHTVYQADFFQYWSAGKVFLLGLNPYDPEVILKFQQLHWFGQDSREAIMLWYPPIALSIILPFSLFNFEFAVGLWFFLNVFLLIYLIKQLYLHFKLSQNFIKIFLLATFSAAVLYNLIDGQISFILLAGLCFYLLYRAKDNRAAQFIGGLALSLTLIKPHLLYLLYIFIFAESLRFKRYTVFAGICTGLLSLSLLPLLINVNIFNYYFLAATKPPIDFRTPTLGSWLQELTNIHQLWLRMLPTIITSCALIVYLSRKKVWDKELAIFLLPFSLLFSPYGWNNDQVLLLPVFFLLLKVGYPNFYVSGALMSLQLISVYFLKFPQEFHIIYPMILIIIAVIVRMKCISNWDRLYGLTIVK